MPSRVCLFYLVYVHTYKRSQLRSESCAGPPLPETLRLLAPLASNLEILNLGYNELTGAIPTQIGMMVKIVTAPSNGFLSGNEHTGETIPTEPQIWITAAKLEEAQQQSTKKASKSQAQLKSLENTIAELSAAFREKERECGRAEEARAKLAG